MNRSLLGCDDVLGVWLPLCQSILSPSSSRV